MPVLSALRRLPQRYPVVMHGLLLLLLGIVTFAAMPKWVVHGHGGAHETATLAAVADQDHHDVDEPIVPLPDGTHVHAHYLAGMMATLPAVLAGPCPPAALRDAGSTWRDVSVPDGSLTRLQRPPIV